MWVVGGEGQLRRVVVWGVEVLRFFGCVESFHLMRVEPRKELEGLSGLLPSSIR